MWHLLMVMTVLLSPTVGWTQMDPYFECPKISYFSRCVPSRERIPPAPPPRADDPVPEAERLTAETAPKWSPQLMSPDTPPLVIQLLKDPTPENAREFAIWHLQRFFEISQAQRVMQEALDTDALAQELRQELHEKFGYKKENHQWDLPILEPTDERTP